MGDEVVIFGEGENTVEYGDTALGPPGEYRAVALYSEPSMGVGVVNEEEGGGTMWGILSPKRPVASWRGMKILDQEFGERGPLDADLLDSKGLSYAYSSGEDGYHREEFGIPIDSIIERLESEDIEYSVQEIAREVAHDRVPKTDMVEERFEQEDIYPEDIEIEKGWRDYFTDLLGLRNLVTR